MSADGIASITELTTRLSALAQNSEKTRSWPQEALDIYASHDGWRWGIGREYGGLELDTTSRLTRYVAIARGDMSLALYVTQHDGAADLLAQSENAGLRSRWLPRYARGEALTTIGYSQLTTSRQGGAPAMRVSEVDGQFQFDGVMPWVTGAPHVTNVACGGTLDNGEQLLAVIDLSASGVSVKPASELSALNSTFTCEVFCDGVKVTPDDVIAGPEPQVLKLRSTLRLLLVSATGIGHGLGMIDYIRDDPITADAADEASRQADEFYAALLTLAAEDDPAQSAIDALRARLSAWLVRLAGMTMVRAKGSGFRRGHVAQRLTDEALFFCVWSASGSVREGIVADLSGQA